MPVWHTPPVNQKQCIAITFDSADRERTKQVTTKIKINRIIRNSFLQLDLISSLLQIKSPTNR